MIKEITTIEDLMTLKASEVMTSPVTTVRVSDSVHDVAKLLLENSIGCAAVVDANDVPVGVVTKSDLVRHDVERATLMVGEQDRNPERAKGASEDPLPQGFHLEAEEANIESCMTPSILDVHPATILPAVLKKMVKHGLHHILVTDPETRKIRGVITTFDLLVVMQRLLNPA